MKDLILFIFIALLLIINSCIHDSSIDLGENVVIIKNQNDKSNKTFCVKGKVLHHDESGIEIKPKTEYQIINTENLVDIKYTYNIRLSNNKLSEHELSELAWELKSRLDKEYDRIFINYYLPDDIVGSGAWATSHFDPTLKVKIIGLTPSDIAGLRNKSTSLNKKRNSEKMIGKWIAQGYGGVYYLVLYESHGKIYLAMRDSQSSIETEMIIQNKHGRNIYVEKDGNQFGEYYVINIDGYLEVYDYQGYIERYERIN